MCQLILLLFNISTHSLTLNSTGNLIQSFFLYDETYELQLILGSTTCGMHGAVVVGNYKNLVLGAWIIISFNGLNTL